MVKKLVGNKFRLPILAIICCLLLAGAGFAQGQSGEPDFTLTILHTNDLHAHDEPFIEHGQSVGGLSRIAYLIHQLKEKDPQALVIDAGDIFQGTPLFSKYKGEVEVEALNQCGCQIYTMGNHEFDDGPANLAKQLSAAHFDIINCNLDTSKVPALEALIKPSVVKTIAGHSVAFVGAITPELDELSLQVKPVHLKAGGDNWIEPIKNEVARLKSSGIQYIILVTHCGVDNDKQLAEQIPYVDAIIGGHSHTKLRQPIDITHADGTHTLIVQTGCYGRELGQLQLAFDQRGQVLPQQSNYHLIDVTASVPEDSTLQKYIDQKNEPLAALQKQVVGVALRNFDNHFIHYACDSPIGDLVCDALAESGSQYGVNITFQNRGGIRGPINKGLITMETVEEVLPFDDYAVFATISGDTLLKVLEHSLSGKRGGKFLDVHGLKVQYDPSREPGHRIINVSCQQNNGSYQPLNAASSYRIGVNDYTFGGGEGYDFTSASDIIRTDKRLSSCLESYLIQHKKVAPSPPSRLIPLESVSPAVTN